MQGIVFADYNEDCLYQAVHDVLLSNVKIELLDSAGNVIATTFTNDQGSYEFTNLAPGVEYRVRETQPDGYLTEGGRCRQCRRRDPRDEFNGGIVLHSNEHAVEITSANCSVLDSWGVWADPQGDCILGPQDILLKDVKVELLDSNGHVIATTFTNAQGEYSFEGLAPGLYSVKEYQPAGYYQGMSLPGSTGGVFIDELFDFANQCWRRPTLGP